MDETTLKLWDIVVTTLGIFLSPFVALALSEQLKSRSEKKKAKLDIFSTLTSLRHHPISPDAVRALNLIDIVFVDDFEVRDAWSRYIAALSDPDLDNNMVGESIRKEKKNDLLLQMAKNLRLHRKISSTDLQRTYGPAGFYAEEREKETIRKGLAEALGGRGLPLNVLYFPGDNDAVEVQKQLHKMLTEHFLAIQEGKPTLVKIVAREGEVMEEAH